MTGVAGEWRRHRGALDPLLIGVFAAAVSLAGAARPSFWYDEAATISASYSRSLGQLWHMLGNVDAVHGLYYLLMHGWFCIFPPTEFWSRAPSALAVGGTAAGVVVLGRQLSTRTVAIAAGVICAILPRTTWAGIEARPSALSMMAAVWLTVLLVVAVRRRNAWIWAAYGVRPGHGDRARCVSDAVAPGLCNPALRLSTAPKGVAAVRHCVGRRAVRGGSVRARGGRTSASDQMGCADRAPDDRRRHGAAVFRKKSAVRDFVGTGRGGRYRRIAPLVRAKRSRRIGNC